MQRKKQKNAIENLGEKESFFVFLQIIPTFVA